MGDRIGLRFKDESGEVSDILIHSHWLGRDLIKDAQYYYQQIPKSMRHDDCNTAIAKFLMWIGMNFGEDDAGYKLLEKADLNVQTDEDDCEDNGIWTLDLSDGSIF